MGTLKSIRIYPVKSLDPVDCQQAVVLASGALQGDRQFALMDSDHKIINGKRDDRVHAIRCEVDCRSNRIGLALRGTPLKHFDLNNDRKEIEHWLSDYFQQPISMAEDISGGYPDDTAAPGPTIVSTATLETVASWYENISLQELRLRVRANLEIDGVPPFAEDQFFGPIGSAVPIRIGTVVLAGVNPCQRCKVLMRDSQTGKLQSDFQNTFRRNREQSLPDWVERSRFDHYFRLAVNTILHEMPASAKHAGIISIGDDVSIL